MPANPGSTAFYKVSGKKRNFEGHNKNGRNVALCGEFTGGKLERN